MKGLIFKALNKSTEGYDLVKQGLMESKMKSHVCWNIYGLMFKADKNYAQAVKSFLNAVKLKPDNQQILKDLAVLQTQIKDYTGLLQSREKILFLKPSVPQHWVAFSVAYYLNGEYSQAAKVIDTFQSSVEESATCFNKYESSELFLYQNQCLIKSGLFEDALKQLEKTKSKITDNLSYLEAKATILKSLGKTEEASKVYHELLSLNADNHEYIKAYQNSVTQSKDEKELLTIFDNLDKDFPKSLAIKRLSLDIATGDEFKTRLLKFASHYLQKTIPSLFNSLRGLYNDENKVKLIEQVFTEILESITKEKKLTLDSKTIEPPTTIVWTLKYLAHHYDQVGNTEKALDFINKAISHTPTIVELYLTKGIIYKHAGNMTLASECIDYARRLDLADRYLNTKATKYLLRNDQVQKAEETIALFSKQEPETTHASNIFDMQVMWYETESGNSFYRQKQYGKALRQFTNVEKHFDDIFEDQQDFHSYSLRKMTLRAYIEMNEFYDTMLSQKFYFKAACGAVKTYIQLYDTPYVPLVEPKEEKKKEKGPQKKQAPFDSEAEKMASVTNPLEIGTKYMKDLLKYSNEKVETHVLSIEFFLRKKKYLLVLSSIKKLMKLSPQHPSIHKGLCHLYLSDFKGLDETVKKVLEVEKESLIGKDVSIETFNANFMKKATTILQRSIAGQILFMINSKNLNQSIEFILSSEKGSLKEWKESFEIVSRFKDQDSIEKFKKAYSQKLPFASPL